MENTETRNSLSREEKIKIVRSFNLENYFAWHRKIEPIDPIQKYIRNEALADWNDFLNQIGHERPKKLEELTEFENEEFEKFCQSVVEGAERDYNKLLDWAEKGVETKEVIFEKWLNGVLDKFMDFDFLEKITRPSKITIDKVFSARICLADVRTAQMILGDVGETCEPIGRLPIRLNRNGKPDKAGFYWHWHKTIKCGRIPISWMECAKHIKQAYQGFEELPLESIAYQVKTATLPKREKGIDDVYE